MSEGAQRAAEEAREEAHNLSEHVKVLTDEFRTARIHDQLLRRLVLAVTTLVIAAIVAGTIFGITLYVQQNQVRNFLVQGVEARNSIALIKDCIDPKGECAKRTSKQTGEILKKIIDTDNDGKADNQEILNELSKLEAKSK